MQRGAVVLGASGLIGSHLLRVGRQKGVPIVGTSFRQRLVDLRPLDITDPVDVSGLLRSTKPGVIFFPAANPNVDLCETDPEGTRRINVDPVQAVADIAAELGSRIVFYSSDYVFDGQNGPYAEDDLTNPICEYGRQKLAAEEILRECVPDQHLILRVTVVYGWENQGKNFVSRLVRTLREGQSMRVPNDQIGSPTLVDDIAEASWSLAELSAGGTLHLAGPNLLDRFSFARQTAQVFGLDAELVKPVTTAELAQAAARPLRAGMISEKAENHLNRGLVGVSDGLARLKAQNWT
jgi:dTDP-4-dehydrorhamnose reductase